MALIPESSENLKSIDAKGRFAIPSRIRKLLQDEILAVIKGFNGCLFAYSQDKWLDIKERLEKPSFNAEHIKRSRVIGATMEEVEIDKQGRILLSKGLMEYAGLKPNSSVLVNYAFDRIEIWQVEKFRENVESKISDDDYEKMLQSLFE